MTLAIIIVLLVLTVVLAWAFRPSTSMSAPTVTVICLRCGTTRTTVFDPSLADATLLAGKRSMTYRHPPATDGFSVCLGIGHDWAEIE